MRRITKTIFGLLLPLPALLFNCSDCEDCDSKVWTDEYHIANASKYSVEIVKFTVMSSPIMTNFTLQQKMLKISIAILFY